MRLCCRWISGDTVLLLGLLSVPTGLGFVISWPHSSGRHLLPREYAIHQEKLFIISPRPRQSNNQREFRNCRQTQKSTQDGDGDDGKINKGDTKEEELSSDRNMYETMEEYDGENGMSDELIDVDTVSDAEALLACRAYLQRRNRLQGGWEEFERRKSMRNIPSTERSSYFWHDPSELVFLKNDDEDDDDVQQFYAEPSSWEDQETGIVVFDSTDDNENNDIGKEFTTFPKQPSKTRILRSEAALRTWKSDEFREKWHERRWGNKLDQTEKKQVNAHQKRLEKRVRAIPPGLLGSPELAALTEVEIEEAIRTYLMFQKKHTATRSKTEAQRKKALAPPGTDHRTARLSRDDLLKEDEAALEEARRLRGERAKKAYQTRLKNKASKTDATTKINRIGTKGQPLSTSSVPPGKTPKDALLRIEAQLDQGELPNIEDIELMLQPPKLGGRKNLLLRILRDIFDLRGKCIPANLDHPDDDETVLVFATQCTFSRLGKFVIYKLRLKTTQNID